MNKRAASMLAALAVVACSSAEAGGGKPADASAPAAITHSDKLDVLLMIDNSTSMADKQSILATAIPSILDRLSALGSVKDIHVGVITSSLGTVGGGFCNPADAVNFNPHQNDRAHLIGKVRDAPSYNHLGFLAWDPAGRLSPPGASDIAAFESDVVLDVEAVGEDGCGFEAQLEAWYRFLVDPAPSRVESYDRDHLRTITGGIDGELLEERAAFLRPDSAVAVIMLTDENDCSIVDKGASFLVGYASSLPSPTSECSKDPDDPCCHSCAEQVLGCPPTTSYPQCAAPLVGLDDNPNMRCWEQKRRFGLDLLFPVARYVNALTKPGLCTDHVDLACDPGEEGVANPLFSVPVGADGAVRDPSLVVLAGIVGVPWQDLATDDTLKDASRLQLLSAAELAARGRWDVIAGDPEHHIAPKDPFMIESQAPRSGKNPVTGDGIAPTTSPLPLANPINGHEYSIPDLGDLQYACIFPLLESRDCAVASGGCDCFGTTPSDNPLCQDPATGASGATQYFAKGYPGLRELGVLHGLGDSAVVASICPRTLEGDKQSSAYGYNAAVDAIVARLGKAIE